MTRIVPIALTAVGVLSGACSKTGAQVDVSAQTPSQALTVPTRPAGLEQQVTAAQYPREFANAFGSVTTKASSPRKGRFEVVQEMPALGLHREVKIAIHTDHQVDISRPPLRTFEGDVIFPVHQELIEYEGGYDLLQAFFVPYETLDPALLEQLGVDRRQARSRWSEFFTVHAQVSLPGIVVASVTTTTGSGVGPTFFNPVTQSGNNAVGKTAPSSQLDIGKMREGYLETLYPDVPPELRLKRHIDDVNRYEKWMCESRDAQMSRIEQKLYPWTKNPSQWSQAEMQVSKMLQQSGNAQQQTARVQAAQSAQSRTSGASRVGQALAIVQAIGEWGQQALDWIDCDDDLQQAKDCWENPTNPTAQNAKRRDPANYKKSLDQLEAAESANNWNTGVRALNTGNSLAANVTTGIPPAAGGAIGLMSSGSNAMLRELTQEEVGKAVRGVTPCGLRWVTAVVSYNYSLAFRNYPPTRGRTNDRGNVTQRMDGVAQFAIDTRGQIVQSRGNGEYRWNETGGYDCVTYGHHVEGQIRIEPSGQSTGFKEIDVGGKTQRVGVFDLTLKGTGRDLERRDDKGQGFDRDTVSGVSCKPYNADRGFDGTADIGCHFEEVPLLAGGTFYSDGEQQDRSNPNHVEITSCRVEIRP